MFCATLSSPTLLRHTLSHSSSLFCSVVCESFLSFCMGDMTLFILSRFVTYSFTFLPIILITGAMPYIVELEQNLESTRVRFCPDALAENIRIGSVGSMVWKGDLNQMRR